MSWPLNPRGWAEVIGRGSSAATTGVLPSIERQGGSIAPNRYPRPPKPRSGVDPNSYAYTVDSASGSNPILTLDLDLPGDAKWLITARVTFNPPSSAGERDDVVCYVGTSLGLANPSGIGGSGIITDARPYGPLDYSVATYMTVGPTGFFQGSGTLRIQASKTFRPGSAAWLISGFATAIYLADS